MTPITYAEARKMLRCSDKTLRRLVAEGWLTNHGTTRRPVLDLHDVGTVLTRRAIARGLTA